MSQQKDNSGVLFRNSRKKFKPRVDADAPREPLNDTEAKKPDYTGEVKVDGADFWIAAWIKESKTQGQKYFSLALTRKNGGQEP